MIYKFKNYSITEQKINHKINSILRAKIDNEIDIIINQQIPNKVLTKKDESNIKKIIGDYLSTNLSILD